MYSIYLLLKDPVYLSNSLCTLSIYCLKILSIYLIIFVLYLFIAIYMFLTTYNYEISIYLFLKTRYSFIFILFIFYLFIFYPFTRQIRDFDWSIISIYVCLYFSRTIKKFNERKYVKLCLIIYMPTVLNIPKYVYILII